MPQQDLLLYLKKYSPKVAKIDKLSGDEDVQKKYEIQCSLAKNLKLTSNIKEFLPDLLEYCHGDVLRSSLPSLYSSFYRIPVNQLYSALEKISMNAVSVRKHAIFLSSLLLPLDELLLKYQGIQYEKNSSVKQHIFLSCYKFFAKNNLPECWPILRDYIDHLEKNQKDVLKVIIQVSQVPKQYRPIFIEHVWFILNKLKKENVKLDENMNSLLNNLKKQDIICLKDTFCMDLIESNLFGIDECSMEDSVFDFVRKFLLYGGNSKNKISFCSKLFMISNRNSGIKMKVKLKP
ncbi:hypothetical protein HHI36_009445 [Cryptolaemus montrouzieri]|uniref:Uncharacterized protein n=1 Tax=Cryptolaemus montrouzieri TaxID=559131 RepID=A0ABD2MFN1_9CUCU